MPRVPPLEPACRRRRSPPRARHPAQRARRRRRELAAARGVQEVSPVVTQRRSTTMDRVADRSFAASSCRDAPVKGVDWGVDWVRSENNTTIHVVMHNTFIRRMRRYTGVLIMSSLGLAGYTSHAGAQDSARPKRTKTTKTK